MEVTRVRENEFESAKDARFFLKKLHAAKTAFLNEDTGWRILIGKPGVRKTGAFAGYNNDQAQSVAAIPELLRKGVLAFTERTRAGEGEKKTSLTITTFSLP